MGTLIPLKMPTAAERCAQQVSIHQAVRAYVHARHDNQQPPDYIIEAVTKLGIDPDAIDRQLPLYVAGL